jgi:hypothetical protein
MSFNQPKTMYTLLLSFLFVPNVFGEELSGVCCGFFQPCFTFNDRDACNNQSDCRWDEIRVCDWTVFASAIRISAHD